MHGSSAQGVVDLELEEHNAYQLKDNVSDDSVNDGSPRLENVAAGSDGDKAAENTIADSQEVPGLLQAKRARVSIGLPVQ